MLRLCVPLLALSLLLAGCVGNRSLVGSWEASTKMMGQDVAMTQTFSEDGTVRTEFTSEIDTRGPFGALSVKVIGKGTYTLEGGEKLTTDIKEVSIEGLPPGMGRGAKERAEGELVKQRRYIVQWINQDKITMTPTRGPGFQLTRIAAPSTKAKP